MGLPAWWGDRAERRRQNARTRHQERDHARETGGKPQPGSGSSWRAPGDVRGAEYLDELKWTMKRSFSISIVQWEDIRRKAHSLGREPRMIIEFPDLKLVVQEWDSPLSA